MSKKYGNLYICPTVNAMEPVTDSKHTDLLNTWEQVDDMLNMIFNHDYRTKYLDINKNPTIFSWFFISWSGFKTNPVKRDFGYFNIYDHYFDNYADTMKIYGDELYWMYNHPPASGIGNEWGLDWSNNSHYLEILMRYVSERNYFPSVVEVITEKNDTSHFLENYFPYDLSNRNSVDVNWNEQNADGKIMSEVIDWREASHDWTIYSPSEENYQHSGNMNRKIGRLLDIKSIVYEFKEYEFVNAFQKCLEGTDVMISAYEHDFRNRTDVIHKNFLEPLKKISRAISG